jgi:hypothetical protein
MANKSFLRLEITTRILIDKNSCCGKDEEICLLVQEQTFFGYRGMVLTTYFLQNLKKSSEI